MTPFPALEFGAALMLTALGARSMLSRAPQLPGPTMRPLAIGVVLAHRVGVRDGLFAATTTGTPE